MHDDLSPEMTATEVGPRPLQSPGLLALAMRVDVVDGNFRVSECRRELGTAAATRR
jgi:hypothetical protein